jgi:Ca2+-binding EF-hand superfamily protein
MKKTVNYLTIISCFALGASLVHADSREHSGKMHEQMNGDQMPGQMHGEVKENKFKEMDTNGDGAISEAEFNAFHAKRFKEMEANSDGKITHDEMEAGHKKMMGKSMGKTL